jgi:hypothetical protein
MRCAFVVALLFAFPVYARAQGCTSDYPPPPSSDSQMRAWAQRYQAWCERHGGTYHVGPSCTPGPNWCPEERRQPSPPPPPPPTPDKNNAPNEDIERQKQEENKRVLAEAARKNKEKFDSDKADILKHLKGSGSTDLPLKDSTVTLGLKGIDDSTAMAKCEQRAKADEAYHDLKRRIAIDEQIIRNFGFSQRAADIQAWTELGEEARQSYEKKAHGILVDLAFGVIEGGLRSMVATARVMSNPLKDQILTLFKAAHINEDDPAYQIAQKVGQTLTVKRAHILVRRLEQMKEGYDAGKDVKETYKGIENVSEHATVEDSLDLAHSVLSVGGWFNPNIKLLAKDLDTISLAVYATQYNVAKYQISRLTRLSETQLKRLPEVMSKLKADIEQLRNLEKALKSLPTCDSTKFVHK